MLTTMAVLVLLLLTIEAAYLWLGRLDRVRAEAAYWAARNTRPPLYDWEREGL